MNVPELLAKYDLKPKGVIQVGSHWGEEIPLWNLLGIPSVHFEPVRKNYQQLLALHPEAVVYPVALGQYNHVVEMHCETINGGQSCSVLAPKTHLDILPWITFDYKEKVVMCRLDDFKITHCNFLYMDAQGYELDVLGGGSSTVSRYIDFIITEVNRTEVFSGCPCIDDMDSYLSHCGKFKRVETEWHGGDFGDALYVR